MINLPKDVLVLVVFKDFNGKINKTTLMTKCSSVMKCAKMLTESNRDFRIFPTNFKTSSIIKVKHAWNEGLTLEEFKEYLNE